jgi:hypothetical protein
VRGRQPVIDTECVLNVDARDDNFRVYNGSMPITGGFRCCGGPGRPSCRLVNFLQLHRVTTFLENLEMSGILVIAREMSVTD